MSELQERLQYAEGRAREIEAEKHFFDAAQPFYPLGFSVVYRNPGDWDVYAQRCPGKASAWRAAHPNGSTSDTDDARERAFRIRSGGKHDVVVMDGRWNPHRPMQERNAIAFRSVQSAMLWICEELMMEPAP